MGCILKYNDVAAIGIHLSSIPSYGLADTIHTGQVVFFYSEFAWSSSRFWAKRDDWAIPQRVERKYALRYVDLQLNFLPPLNVEKLERTLNSRNFPKANGNISKHF